MSNYRKIREAKQIHSDAIMRHIKDKRRGEIAAKRGKRTSRATRSSIPSPAIEQQTEAKE